MPNIVALLFKSSTISIIWQNWQIYFSLVSRLKLENVSFGIIKINIFIKEDFLFISGTKNLQS